MRSLVVNEKTGFDIIDPSQTVIIRDARHMLFYSNESIKPRAKQFNLPGFGQFYIDTGSIRKLDKPVEYEMSALPLLNPRAGLRPPYDFPIVWGDNPNKCTIMWEQGKIFADNKIKQMPLPQACFILEHEYAHYYTRNDTLCDKIAGNYMKKLGFNPVQIGESSIYALSSRQLERKVALVDSLIQAQ